MIQNTIIFVYYSCNILMTYKEGYEAIINKYDVLKAEIENKEITETYTEEMKEQELKDNEEARKKELQQYDIDYKNAMDSIQNMKPGIDYEMLETKIENIDFVAPAPLVGDTLNTERAMEALPSTINNTKYIYLTFDNKYLAIKQLEEEEYVKYSQEFDAIGPKYDTLAANINNKYDTLKAEIENKEITETYTDEMKTQELKDNEEARNNELTDNEGLRETETTTLNNNYIESATKIGIALTELKNDKETGFIGDVHIHGKLHVDTNINIEGELNNVPISDYLTKDDKTELTQIVNSKADVTHTHNINDIEGYNSAGLYDDTELRELIDNKADFEHIHTIKEIVDYDPYDDTEIRGLINNNDKRITLLEYREPETYDDTELREAINGKADVTHTHNINDIVDYEPYDDTELREAINGKADVTHTHTSINNTLTITDNGPYWGCSKILTCLNQNLTNNEMIQFILGKADQQLHTHTHWAFRMLRMLSALIN